MEPYAPEPRLDDLLADPVLRLMMRRDGVTRDGLMELAEVVRRSARNARRRAEGVNEVKVH